MHGYLHKIQLADTTFHKNLLSTTNGVCVVLIMVFIIESLFCVTSDHVFDIKKKRVECDINKCKAVSHKCLFETSILKHLYNRRRPKISKSASVLN